MIFEQFRKNVAKPHFAKFVRRETKHQLMKNKRNLKNTNVFANDDLTPFVLK